MLKFLVALSIMCSSGACNEHQKPVITNQSHPLIQTPKTANLDDLPLPPKATINLIAERLIHCGGELGTADYIAPNIFMTANHVLDGQKTCKDVATGMIYQVYYSDQKTDFALLKADTQDDPRFQRYSCEGFKAGKTYFSIGYAWGSNFVIYKQIATDKYTDKNFKVDGEVQDHLRELNGVLIPGMSGGAVFDENGVIYGINNVTNLGSWNKAWSRELKDTVLCKH